MAIAGADVIVVGRRRRPGCGGARARAAARGAADQDRARRRAAPAPGRRAASPPRWAAATRPRLHAADTLAAGARAQRSRHRRACSTERAPRRDRARWSALGARFDRDADGSLALGREAAHSAAASCTPAATPPAPRWCARSSEAVRRASRGSHLRARPSPSSCWSRADAVTGVLASIAGGAAAAPAHRRPPWCSPPAASASSTATPPTRPELTGDGLAMAARAGARLVDLEFVQFHPTALAAGARPAAAADRGAARRGRGARRRDRRRFMLDVHRDAELAPRDVVARAISAPAAAGQRVFLDARAALGERIPEALPDRLPQLPRRRPRPARRADPGDAGRALLHGRRRGRRARPHHARRPVGLRRGVRHRRARRQPAGSQLAARGAGVRQRGGGRRPAASAPGRRSQRERAIAARGGAGRVAGAWSDDSRASRGAGCARSMWDASGWCATAPASSAALDEIDAHRAPSSASARGELRNLLNAGRLVATAALARRETPRQPRALGLSRSATSRCAATCRSARRRPQRAAAGPPSRRRGVRASMTQRGKTCRGAARSCRGAAEACRSAAAARRRAIPTVSSTKTCCAARCSRTSAAPATSPPTPSSTRTRARAAQFVARRAGRDRRPARGARRLRLLDPALDARVAHADGGDVDGRRRCSRAVAGSARALLTGERVALNLLGRLCGIATATRDLVARDRAAPRAHRLHPQDDARPARCSRSTRCASAAAPTTASGSTTRS